MLTSANAKRIIKDWLIDCTIDTEYYFDIDECIDMCDAANQFVSIFENVIFEFENGKDIDYIKDMFNNKFPINDADWIILFQTYVDLNKDEVNNFIEETGEIEDLDSSECCIDISKINF